MDLLRITKSDKCPNCGSKEGKCGMMVQTLETFETQMDKISEDKFLNEYLGRSRPREVYFFNRMVCNNERKRK
jgi:hypothetical protein